MCYDLTRATVATAARTAATGLVTIRRGQQDHYMKTVSPVLVSSYLVPGTRYLMRSIPLQVHWGEICDRYLFDPMGSDVPGWRYPCIKTASIASRLAPTWRLNISSALGLPELSRYWYHHRYEIAHKHNTVIAMVTKYSNTVVATVQEKLFKRKYRFKSQSGLTKYRFKSQSGLARPKSI